MISNKIRKTTLVLIIFSMVFTGWFTGFLLSGCGETTTPEAKEGYVVEILGQEETCMNCHADYTGFAPAHNPQNIGCSPCHGGNPLASDSETAHAGMKLIPGNLSDVNQTCGAINCHGDIAARVENSLMTSMSGVISVNRFVFGESDNLNARAHVKNLKPDHASDVHLRQLCASCHLGNEKIKPGPVNEKSRGGGCIACHIDYSQNIDFQEDTPNQKNKFHPAINLFITNEHCFGCHSRSGRISTNFEGWHETKLDAKTYADKKGYRLLADGRIFQKIKSDVHHELGLQCIDCHSAKEVMGDGTQYFHEEEAVKIRCEDCHFAERPKTKIYDDLDIESKKILQLRRADYLDAAFIVGKDSEDPIINVILEENGQAKLVGKNTGKYHDLKPPAEICTRGSAHDALNCNACHTDWAPQCVGCHNTFEKEEFAFDLLEKKKVPGKWTEYLGEFFAEPPTLGVVLENEIRKIKPFVPGMIMTIDKSGFAGEEKSSEIFHRLFAPVAPHTTNREGRTCKSCHNNPVALGYGRGDLNFDLQTKKWQFTSEYENMPQDDLPQDAWIGFMKQPKRISTTRTNALPFSVKEQQKILRVGTCLTCHKEDSKVMSDGIDNFEKVSKGMSGDCIAPVWD